MSREPISTYFFVLAVVRKGDRFLLVHERKHDQLWYLPAGRVEQAEELIAATERETLEEAGVPVQVDGLIRMEHKPTLTCSRVRLFLSCKPSDDTPPKSSPDKHSLKAGWFTIEEIKKLPLRGKDVLEVCSFLDRGGYIAPLSVLSMEGAPFETTNES